MDSSAQKLGANLGRRLRLQRQAQGLTQAQVAEAVGIEPDTVGRMERGTRLPSLSVLALLAGFLGVEVVELLADDDAWARAADAAPHQRRLVALALRVPAERADAAARMLGSLRGE